MIYIPEEKAFLAWHFLPKDGFYANDLSKKRVVVGETLSFDRGLWVCKRGLHASRKVIDAAYYAPSNIVSRCLIWGDLEEEWDKLVASKRKPLWVADCSLILPIIRERIKKEEPAIYRMACKYSLDWSSAYQSASVCSSACRLVSVCSSALACSSGCRLASVYWSVEDKGVAFIWEEEFLKLEPKET